MKRKAAQRRLFLFYQVDSARRNTIVGHDTDDIDALRIAFKVQLHLGRVGLSVFQDGTSNAHQLHILNRLRCFNTHNIFGRVGINIKSQSGQFVHIHVGGVSRHDLHIIHEPIEGKELAKSVVS